MFSKYNFPLSKINTYQQNAIEKFKNEIKHGTYKYIPIYCPICKSGKNKVLFKNDRYGINVNTTLCNNCGLVYQNPILREDSLRLFYASGTYRDIYGGISQFEEDNIYKKYEFDKDYNLDEKKYSSLESLYHFIRNSGITFSSICEIGAGGGWNLLKFMNDGIQVTGYEPDERLVELGNTYGIPIQNGFVENIKGEFDLVILKHVIEHLTDPVASLRLIRDHISKYLFVEIPGIVDRIPSLQNAHICYFSINTIKRILALTGFDIIRLMYFYNNNFIQVLAKKNDNSSFEYSRDKEISMINRIYYLNRLRYLLGSAKKIITKN